MFLQAMTTRAPLFDRSRAASSPIPELEPVITKVLPSSPASLLHLPTPIYWLKRMAPGQIEKKIVYYFLALCNYQQEMLSS